MEALLLPLLNSAYGTAMHLTPAPGRRRGIGAGGLAAGVSRLRYLRAGYQLQGIVLRILTNCFYSKYRKRKREGTQLELEDSPELYLYCQTAAAGLHARTGGSGHGGHVANGFPAGW